MPFLTRPFPAAGETRRRHRGPASRLGWLALALIVALVAPLGLVSAANVATDFEDEFVASVPLPIALAFTPDGRMLVTSKGGKLFVKRPDAAQPTVALNLAARMCDNKERGLLGVAVDPNFGANRSIYLYYTFKDGTNCPEDDPTQRNPVNRVSRFTLRADDKVSPASEKVLIDNIPSPNGNHNGGDIQFGQDGNLYVTVGDGGCDLRKPDDCQPDNRNARRLNLLLGKILRITPNGEIPNGNPFTGAGSKRCNETGAAAAGTTCREIFAYGLRNPFRFAFDPNAEETRFFINDVGWQTWEEIDEGEAGADFGWNQREGFCPKGQTEPCAGPPQGQTDPFFAYEHNTGCQSITGGAFVPDDADWPATYDGAYLYADFVCDKIFVLDAGGRSKLNDPFAKKLGKPIHLAFGPNGSGQALYYTTFENGGEVHRIVPTNP